MNLPTPPKQTPSQLDFYVADAILGIDTLWGGDK